MSSIQTVFVTVTATGTPIPSLNATQQAALKNSETVGQWAALSIFGAYILFGICVFVGYLIRRATRPPPQPSTENPDTIKHGKGAFLPRVPGQKRNTLVKKSTMESTWTPVSEPRNSRISMFAEDHPYSAVSPVEPSPPLPSPPLRTRASLSADNSSPYTALPPGPPSPPRTSYRRHPSSGNASSSHRYSSKSNRRQSLGYLKRYSSSQTNLIPLESPSPPVPSKVGFDVDGESTPRAGRSRSSSQSSSRFYRPEIDEPLPMLPNVALIGGPVGGYR